MAGTRQSGIDRGRRWGLAAAGGLTALAMTAGLGNPWSAGPIGRLDRDRYLDRAGGLVHTLALLRWSTTPAGYGTGAAANHAAWYAGALVLDLGWPLLLFFALRALAAGLLQRYGGFPLFLAGWALSGFTAAVAGLLGGVTQYLVGHSAPLPQNAGVLVTLPGHPQLGDVLTIQAASAALLGLAVGWLPAAVAGIGYVAGRLPEWDVDTGEEPTRVDLSTRRPVAGAGAPGERDTLNLAALEELRNARYGYDPDPDEPGMADPRTSTFFGEGQY